jgi:hypothetical protein
MRSTLCGLAALAVLGAVLPSTATAKPPRGYEVVISPVMTSPHFREVRGSVTCPAGTVPLGGGSFVQSSSTQVAIASTFPTANGWITDVDNESGNDTSFDVRATCARKPPNYAVVESAPVVVPAGGHGSAFAVCPKGSRALGGGGFWDTSGTELTLASSFPGPATWDVSGNNTTLLASRLSAFVVCGKLRGYQLVFGFTSLLDVGQTAVTNTCFAPRVPLSGGAFVDSTSTLVTLNSTAAAGSTDWTSWINNGSAFGVNVEPFVVCAGT